MADLTSAQTARQSAALDKPVRLDGVVTTWRTLIESGAVMYATVREDRDGRKTYGLITHESFREEIHRTVQDAHAFAAYWETPKMVADYFARDNLTVRSFGYNGVEIILPDGTVSQRWESRF